MTTTVRSVSRCFVLLALCHGCSHKLDDPKPTLASVMPNLVCSDQLTTAVTVAGTNLTPVPTKTLAGGEVLAVPIVTLTEETDLSGAAMTSSPIALNAASDTSNTHVRWESEQQMSFDVTPDLMLQAGVYDVTLANPDGKTATLAQVLGVVPPPSVTSATPVHVCDAQMDEMVVLTGQNFLVIGTDQPEVDVFDSTGVAVLTATGTASNCSDAAAQLMEAIQECTTLTFTVPKGALPPGSYTLRVTNPAPAGCQSSETIALTIEPPPVLTDVLPSTICQGGGPLDLKGMNFLPTATASVTDPTAMQTVAATTTMVSADGTDAKATFAFPSGLAAGDKLDVTIDNHDGCTATLPAKVTVVSGPLIFYVDPPFVAQGVVTPVTVYTTGGFASLVKVLLTPHGQPPSTAIDVTASSAPDPNHAKHIIINVPATLAPGAYDLELDTDTCPAFYMNAITVHAASTTDLAVVPAFGNVAENVPVQLTSTSTFIKPGARAYFAPSAVSPPAAIALLSVEYHANAGGTPSLSAIVPTLSAPLPGAGQYDVIVVNADGTIARHAMAYTAVTGAVPTIDPTSPGSVVQNCNSAATCDVILDGNHFNTSAVVDALCGAMTFSGVQLANPTPTATAITLNLMTLAASEPQGTTCTFRLTEPVGGVMVTVTGGTLVVRNSSGNLGGTTVGKHDLGTARRGHGSAFSGPTAAARYLYVFGGDDGTTTTTGTNLLRSLEFAEVDPSAGDLKSTWTGFPLTGAASSTQGELPSARTFLGATSVGRYLYAIGGMTAGGPSNQVLRAESLDPAESPRIDDADLTPDKTAGLGSGLYFYRVAAIFDGTDALNPGGETLASDEFAINVPSFGAQKIDVTIAWAKSALVTAQGRTPASWRVYRTSAPNAAPGSEDEFADVAGTATTIVDVGTGIYVPGPTPPPPTAYAAGTPLPFGALGNWKATAFTLSSVRAAPAVAHVIIAAQTGGGVNDAIYAAYGATNAGATTLSATYDGFTVALDANDMPTETLFTNSTTGGVGLSTARWLAGGFGVMDTASPLVWFGPGNGTGATDFNHCTVSTSVGTYGLLTCGTIANVSLYGYGAIAADHSLFTFGGVASGGVTDKIGKLADDASSPAFSANGGGTIQVPVAVSYPLAYEGAVIGGAYIWLTGGVTTAGLSAKTFFDLY